MSQRSKDQIFADWSKEWGTVVTNNSGISYVRFDPTQYMESFDSLVQTFIRNGYEESDIRSKSILVKLLETVTSDYSKKPQKWKGIVEKTWKLVLDNTFADSSQVAPPKGISVGKPIVRSENESENRPSAPIEPKEYQEVTDDIRINMPSYEVDEIDFLADIESDDDEPK